VLLLHAAQRRQDVILFTHALFRPLRRDPVIARKRCHPSFVFFRSLTENFLADNRNAQNLPEEVDHLLGSRQIAQVAVDDDTVETVVYKKQQAAKQLCKCLHRSSSPVLVLTTRSSDRRPVVSKFQISLASFLHRTRDNKLTEFPVTWYPEDGKAGGHWGMSPAYDRPDHPGFSREV